VAALVEAAAALEAAAKNASGAAAAYAWLQAADCWKRAGKADERMKALEAAAQVGAPDLAGYAADAAWAGALRDAGRTEESIGHWRKMAGSYQAALREESLVNLALEQVQAGKAEDAKATAEEFKKLFPDSPRAAALAAIGS
jgi:tetratricopeptide (TPR) repeat protein